MGPQLDEIAALDATVPSGEKRFDPARHTHSVSTLVPGLHDQPLYRYFEDASTALLYAKSRAFKGRRMREGGKAYFVLSGDGSTVYRVFRGMRGEETRRGGGVKEARREYIIVQSARGLLPNNKTHWVWEHGLSVEIPNAETERELHRQRTRGQRYYDETPEE